MNEKVVKEVGSLILELKRRKQKILKMVEEHMDYISKKEDEIKKIFEDWEKEASGEEERIEIHKLGKNIKDILEREWSYWYNVYRVITDEVAKRFDYLVGE